MCLAMHGIQKRCRRLEARSIADGCNAVAVVLVAVSELKNLILQQKRKAAVLQNKKAHM